MLMMCVPSWGLASTMRLSRWTGGTGAPAASATASRHPSISAAVCSTGWLVMM